MRSKYLFRSVPVVAFAAVALVLVACAPPAPTPLPNPLISCDRIGGDVTYSPPAQNLGVDVTVTAQPGSGLSGCVDHTGNGITSGSMTGSFLLPAFMCIVEPAGVIWGTGTGGITWSNGATSAWRADLVGTGVGGRLILDFTFTGGAWTGATASVEMVTPALSGDCVNTPLTSATFANNEPFVLHPAGAAPPAPLTGASQIAAGYYHNCALMTGGSVKCWGDDFFGELGNGTSSNAFGVNIPVGVVGVSGATAVNAGSGHSCALVAGGAVKCWGSSTWGQLGNGTTTGSLTPVDVTGVAGATAISTLTNHTCALVAGGTVKCWGKNDYGQLGDGTTTNRPNAVAVSGLTGATSVSAGFIHSCAIVTAGAVKCWGDNFYGQLGDGSTTSSLTPVDVTGVTGAAEVTTSPTHSCALVAGGAVTCWGDNTFGELGNGTNTSSTTPVAVTGLSGITHLAAGNGAQTCAVLADGSVKCWGRNYYGQLGDGTTINSNVPVAVSGLSGATATAGGYEHTCAVVTGGGVKCWGHGLTGQLGNGTFTNSLSPVSVLSY